MIGAELSAITIGLYGLSHAESAEQAQRWIYSLPKVYMRQLAQEHLFANSQMHFVTGIESSDCTSLANLAQVAQQEGYRANVGFVTFDDEKLVRRKIARFHSSPVLKAYGLDNLELLQNSPF